jgi:DNA polymerase III epsilon subunit-like protein
MKTNKNKEGVYLVADFETSGLFVGQHAIIQLGYIIVNKNLEIIEEYSTYVCPPKKALWDLQAQQIHGLSRDQVEKEGVSYKLLCEHLLAMIERNFEKPPIMVAQFFPFEYQFLTELFNEGLGQDKRLLDKGVYGVFQKVISRNFIDTKVLASFVNMQNTEPFFKSTSLSSPQGLIAKLGIEIDYKAHDALGDCKATLEVLKAFKHRFKFDN